MKSLFPVLVAGTMLALPLAPEALALSKYWDDPSGVDYSGMTPFGGTIIVPMVLYEGDPVPGYGTSFNVVFTISPVTSFFPPAAMQWGTELPVGTEFGWPYPGPMFEDLPASNTNPLPFVINGFDANIDPFGWWAAAVAEGLVQYTGSFTISTEAPVVPPGYELVVNSVAVGSWQNLHIGSEDVRAGVYANTETLYWAFGDVIPFNFLGFSADGPVEPPTNEVLVWFAFADLYFEVIPEPSHLSLLAGAGGMIGWHLLRRRRARAGGA